MAKIISKIDTKLIIPPNFKKLTGNKPIELEFKAEEITEVPDNIAEYYVKSRPHVFRYFNSENFSLSDNDDNETEKVEIFEPATFFENNLDRIEEAITNLTDRKELFAICKFLGLTNYGTQSNDRIKERILADIKIQKEMQEKVGNN